MLRIALCRIWGIFASCRIYNLRDTMVACPRTLTPCHFVHNNYIKTKISLICDCDDPVRLGNPTVEMTLVPVIG
jgi:hypothetical protein